MTALSGLLDELMGKNRNAAPNEKSNELHWSDEEVCKHFLAGFCPAELFTNTRSDLGACDKTHDEQTRKNYEKSPRYLKMGYEEEFLRFLQQCWQDVERRIRRNHQRLQLSEEKNQQKQPVQSSENMEKIQVLNGRITEMLESIEKLGSEGEVEQAQSLMKLCDQLKEERELLQSQKGGIMDTFAVQEKQMEVCEVCGAFLIVGDAQSRVDDHLMGKQHMGYAKIKTAIVELKEKLAKAASENKRPEKTSDRDRSSRDRDRRNNSSRDVDRRPRDYGRSSRDRDRRSRDDRSARDQDRRRSRDRTRRSSRDRDRRRSRDRERRRSRDVDRRRSRDRERRSSRDRKDEKRRHDRSRSRDHKRSKRSSSKDRKSRRSSEKTHKSSESSHHEKSADREENNHKDQSDVQASIKSDENNKSDTNVDKFEPEDVSDNNKTTYSDDTTQNDNNVLREGESNTN